MRRGIAPVLEARRLFPRMTCSRTWRWAPTRASAAPEFDEDLERVYGLFPRVKERRNQIAGTLSGGEQQMVAMGRALMARPKLICMDEPSMGLSPLYVEQVFDIIQAINKQGTTIFMVEQNANMALSIAHRAYVLQTGSGRAVGHRGRVARQPDDPRGVSGRDAGGRLRLAAGCRAHWSAPRRFALVRGRRRRAAMYTPPRPEAGLPPVRVNLYSDTQTRPTPGDEGRR